jgi:hypothetical protein
MIELQKLLGKVAPWIAAAAAGPGGLAAQAIKTAAEALDAPGETVEQVATALAGAAPEQLARLREAEQAFQLRMRELGFSSQQSLTQLAGADRADARKREAATGDSATPRLLAGAIVLGWFLEQAYLLGHVVPQDMREIIMRTLGTLDMGLGLVLGYYFGSSNPRAPHADGAKVA